MESMIGYQCQACGRAYYPERRVCLACGNREMRQVPLDGEGTLLTFTRLHALPMDFETRTLMLGIVQFANGIRALGQLGSEQVEMGMRMKARWEVVRELEGEEVYGLKFYPAGR